ncbi:MAG: sterol desaturase family protein [Bacteroidia bacterium]|nr:sterol desaturase family protein [Bacteroidia bacterium]
MNPNYIVYAIPVFLLFIFFELLVSVIKNKKDSFRLNDSIANLSIGIGEQVISVFSKAGMLVLYDFVYQYRITTIPSNILTGIALLLLFDFIFYWAHRFGHEVNLGWGGHIVHHSSEEYNLTVALRQPWFFSMMTFAMFLPIAWLGFSPKLLIIISGIDILFQFWIHTRFVPKLGFLEWFLNTPSHHRVHHGKNPQYIDKNYGGVFIIYDRLFGTFMEEKEEVIYGITHPVNSWNPSWANFHYYLELWNESKKLKRLKDKVLLWFKPPGWTPIQTENKSNSSPVNLSTKFDFPYPYQLKPYLLFQFALLVVISMYYLSVAGQSLVGWKSILVAFYILFTVSVIGMLFEKSKEIYWLEFIRLMTLPILLFIIRIPSAWAISTWICVGFSLVWLMLIAFGFQKK